MTVAFPKFSSLYRFRAAKLSDAFIKAAGEAKGYEPRPTPNVPGQELSALALRVASGNSLSNPLVSTRLRRRRSCDTTILFHFALVSRCSCSSIHVDTITSKGTGSTMALFRTRDPAAQQSAWRLNLLRCCWAAQRAIGQPDRHNPATHFSFYRV